MIGLDTCVLARFLLGDDPDQLPVAIKLIERNQCHVSWSVLVELFWVLERSCMLPKDTVLGCLKLLAEIEQIIVPNQDLLDWAIGQYAAGADFADMIHLAAYADGSLEFATFDRKLARQAGADAPLAVLTLTV